MPSSVAIYRARSQEIAAYVLVDEEDYARLSAYRWVLQGTPEAPDHIYRYRTPQEREGQERSTTLLTQDVLPHPGYIAFRNGNRLDYRKANLVSPQERQRRVEKGARALLQMNPDSSSGEAAATLPLTPPWAAWIDPSQAQRLSQYRWAVSVRGQNVYALRRRRTRGRGLVTIYLARVITGLQDMHDGTILRPGIVTFKEPPDLDHCRLDLRPSNLMVTTRGGVNLHRLRKRRYRGVQVVRRTGRYRAHIKLDGCARLLGVYDTPEAAARARDAEIIRLGLQDLARLNFP